MQLWVHLPSGSAYRISEDRLATLKPGNRVLTAADGRELRGEAAQLRPLALSAQAGLQELTEDPLWQRQLTTMLAVQQAGEQHWLLELASASDEQAFVAALKRAGGDPAARLDAVQQLLAQLTPSETVRLGKTAGEAARQVAASTDAPPAAPLLMLQSLLGRLHREQPGVRWPGARSVEPPRDIYQETRQHVAARLQLPDPPQISYPDFSDDLPGAATPENND